MSPRQLAHRAMWTDHPLSQLYALCNGEWRDGYFAPATSWSIKQLVDFAETLPPTIIERLGARA